MNKNTPDLPSHIDKTIQSIANLHAEHKRRTTLMQQIVNSLTAAFGQPLFVAAVLIFALVWIGVNLALNLANIRPFDPLPFHLLQLVLEITAVCLAVLILATQRHEDQLADLREQLTLELGILSEKKAAKVIELLEEMRRDIPFLKQRADAQAEAMSTSPEPEEIAEAVKGAHEDLDSTPNRP